MGKNCGAAMASAAFFISAFNAEIYQAPAR